MALIALGFGLWACASKRPVLYPNATYRVVGEASAREDIDDCVRLAEGADLENSRAAEVAKETAASSATGAAVGGAAGAVIGHPGRSAGAAAAGAGAGAVMRGLFRGRDHDPLFKRYVEQCLSERGYQVIGWR